MRTSKTVCTASLFALLTFSSTLVRGAVDVMEADLLCAYAPSYASSVGGEPNAQVILANSIAGVNVVNDNSGTGARLRLAGFYVSTNNPLNATTTGGLVGWLASDARLQDIRDVSIAIGADLVTYVCQSSDSGSIAAVANQPGMYSAFNPNAVWYIVSAHEIGGHNYGCPHADGFGFTGSNGSPYRTVMVHNYCGGTSIPYFTNPNVVYQGVRLQGIAAQNCNTGSQLYGGNNSGRISSYAQTVAGTRQRALSQPNLTNVILRWCFTNAPGTAPAGTTVPDQISAAPAIVRGLNATFTGSGLRLPGLTTGNVAANSIGGYVDLPNGMLSSQTNVTIEIWATPLSSRNWQRLCSFGRTVQAGDGLGAPGEWTGTAGSAAPGSTTALDELALSLNVVTDLSQQRLLTQAVGFMTNNLDSDLPTFAGVQHHYAIVFQDGAGSYGAAGGRVTWYRNAEPVGYADVNFHLSDLEDVNNWLGRSLWSGDAQANAEFAEVRISNAALTRQELQANFRLGPNYFSSRVNLTSHDPLNATSFNAAGNWSSAEAPNASLAYDTLHYSLRTPANSSSHTFQGNELKVSSGGSLLFKGTASATITVTNLLLDGGTIQHAGSGTFTLAGTLNTGPNNGVLHGVNGAINLTARLQGSSAITYLNNATALLGNNEDFSGKHLIGSGAAGTLILDSLARLGATPASFASNSVVFDNGTLQTTSTMLWDEVKRGIYLATNGATFMPNSGTTLTIASRISGTGGITKRGAGTLALTGSNTFAGILNIDSASTSGSDGVVRLSGSRATGNAPLIQIRNNNSASSTLQLDGANSSIVVTQVLNINCRNTGTATIQNLAGTNTLSGRTWLFTGGNLFNLQSDAGQLILSGASQYIGDLTGGRTYVFGGLGDHLVSGAILNSTNGAPINLTKSGTGRLTLTGANTYVGATTVNGGTLLVNGSISTSAVTVASATLGGSGVIRGPVTVQAGGFLRPGNNTIGTLTINNSLTLAGTTHIELNKTAGSFDRVQGLTSVTLGGILVVTNLSGELAHGDSFKLFTAAIYSGSFSEIQPPSPGYGLSWDTSTLGADGTLRVIEVTRPHLTIGGSGNALQLAWPLEQVGWRLQVQTNTLQEGLGTNWFDISGTETTNTFTTEIDPSIESLFYRLVLP